MYMPIELCNVAPGQRRLKLNEKQTAAMIKLAAQKPWDRSGRIHEYVSKSSGLLQDQTLKDFNLTVSPKMIEVRLELLLRAASPLSYLMPFISISQFGSLRLD